MRSDQGRNCNVADAPIASANACADGAITASSDIITAGLKNVADMDFEALLEFAAEARRMQNAWALEYAAYEQLVYNTEWLNKQVEPVNVGRGNADRMGVGKSAFVKRAAAALGVDHTTIYKRAKLYRLFRDEISRDIATGLMLPSFYETAMLAQGQEQEALRQIRQALAEKQRLTVNEAKIVVDKLRTQQMLVQVQREAEQNKRAWQDQPTLIYEGACEWIIPILIEKGALPKNTFRLLFADWPYGINYRDNRKSALGLGVCTGDESPEVAVRGFQQMLQATTPLMMSDAHGLFTTGYQSLRQFMNALESEGWRIINILPWIKGEGVNPMGSRHTWKSNIEYIIHAVRGNPPFYGSGNGVFWDRRERNTVHQFQKPESLMRTLIEATTQSGESVIDPCCGSGSFVVAGVGLDRMAIGIEIDPTHAALATDRVKRLQHKISIRSSH